MATHGTIGEFQAAHEDWLDYVGSTSPRTMWLEQRSNTLSCSVLLVRRRTNSSETCWLLRNQYRIPSSKLWMQSTAPPTQAVGRRFQFHSRVRQVGKSVLAFVAELCKLSEHCNFGEALNDMLHDHLVCGINDSLTQRRLLAEQN